MSDSYDFPAFVHAMDHVLEFEDTELRVYLWCTQYLDFDRFIPYKHVTIAHGAKVRLGSVWGALDGLVARGYIRRGQRVDRVGSYQLARDLREIPGCDAALSRSA